VVELCILPVQRTITGTLGTIAKRCERASIVPPAVLVVGEVVRLRRWLNWFERKPLFGRRIVVTRPTDRARELANLLESLGAEVITLPAVELAAVISNGLSDQVLARIEQFDWVFFTSPEGIHWFRRMLRAERKDLRILHGRHIGAIGPKTAASIQELGIQVDFVPKTFSQDGMLDGLSRRRLDGKRALILSAQDSRDVLEQGLRARGMRVTRLPIYRTLMPAALTKDVRAALGGRVDCVTATSSSCVDHLKQALAASGLSGRFRSIPFASIGPVTSATIRGHGGQVAVEARSATIEGLVEALVRDGVSHRSTAAIAAA